MSARPVVEVLADLEPFSHLGPDELLVLAGRAEIRSLARGAVLFELGQQDQCMFFVLEGRVQLEAADGRGMTVDGGTRAALRPLAQLQPRRYRGVAATAVSCLELDLAGLGAFQAAADDDDDYLVEEVDHHEAAAGGDLAARYRQVLEQGDFHLPSLPHIAMDAVRAIDRDEADARAIAKILLNDPALTAKLIRAANSPLFHGMTQVEDCDKAIVRLGLKTARQLIVAFALRELFEARSPTVRERMEALWQHSTEVAAIAMVLSRRLRCLDPDEAMVAGLLHDIGCVPIYNLAAADGELAADAAALDQLVQDHRAHLGARLLESWNFPPTLVAASRDADHWWRDPGPRADYADLVIVAQLHSYLGRNRPPDVPSMVRLPAFARITARSGLDPEGSMAVLAEARETIDEARSLLAG